MEEKEKRENEMRGGMAVRIDDSTPHYCYVSANASRPHRVHLSHTFKSLGQSNKQMRCNYDNVKIDFWEMTSGKSNKGNLG